MSGIYQKNLAVLRVRFPALAAAAETWESTGITVTAAANGEPTALVNGCGIHSSRAPGNEAARLVRACFSENPAQAGAVILLGFGLGWTAEAIARQDGQSPLLIVEKRHELFRAALEARDLTPLFARKNLLFMISADSHAILAGLEVVKKTGRVIKNRALCELDADFYDEIGRLIEIWASKDRVNQATRDKFGKLWERNNRRNLSGLRDIPGIRYFAGKLPFPVLLAAAGPTLDEIRPHIKALSERMIVIACDTSLRFLAQNDVIPHFAVSTDAQFWNYLHIAALPEAFLRHVTLITESSVYPLAVNAPFKNRFLFAPLYSPAKEAEARIDPKGALGAGGSVATSAWDFARFIGADSIHAAGLDLAFPGYRTHYKGAVFEERIHAAAHRFKPAETLSVEALRSGGLGYAPSADGGKTLTDRRLSLYAAWFENAAKNTPRLPVFRLSGQGIFIKGLQSRDPRALYALPVIKENVDKALDDILKSVEREFYAGEAVRIRAARYTAAITSLAGLG
jgi:hypothetical protein